MYYINLCANFTLHYFSTTLLLYYLIWSKGEIDCKKLWQMIFFLYLCLINGPLVQGIERRFPKP